jgi:hypothetical protein
MGVLRDVTLCLQRRQGAWLRSLVVGVVEVIAMLESRIFSAFLKRELNARTERQVSQILLEVYSSCQPTDINSIVLCPSNVAHLSSHWTAYPVYSTRLRRPPLRTLLPQIELHPKMHHRYPHILWYTPPGL